MSALPRLWLCRDGIPLLQVWQATRWWPRAHGLLGRPPLAPDEGLALIPCNSVHGIGMRYPVELLFLDRQYRILRTASLPLWSVRLCLGAYATVECPVGTIQRHQLRVQQQLEWRPDR